MWVRIPQLLTFSPRAEQLRQVGGIDVTVGVEVGRADAITGSPTTKQLGQVGGGDVAIAINVCRAGRTAVAGYEVGRSAGPGPGQLERLPVVAVHVVVVVEVEDETGGVARFNVRTGEAVREGAVIS